MAAPDRPTGEVTFLFTDIEGSTRLVSTLGTAAWRPLLARHRTIVRDALVAHGGIENQVEGDGFFAVFADAAAATAAVADMQRALQAEPWPDGGAIRVRMGLHTGEGELDAEGAYVGHDVHRAARVGAAGHGGQVLLSEATASLVDGHLGPGLSLRSLGAHRLKDLRPERIAQLVIEGLPADFPPIRSLDARPNNLPMELSSFVGRERELDEIRALLASTRLVTLTGPGGTGKTRLALQVAASLADEYPDGAWFVPLGSVADTDLVIPAIARAMGVGDDPSRSPIDVLATELEPKQALLVIDNLEQVRGAGSDLGELLRRAGRVRILATSRAPLRISGEQEYPVPGLPTPPDLDRLGPLEREQLPAAIRAREPEALAGFESVRLFVARGSSVKPGFAITGANAGDVAAIVAHLGGVPLAIELAAARIRFLTPAAIHERLEGRLDLPGAGAADVPERQRSLRGAIMWSHELLDAPDCRLFERLGVFMGGFDLPRAEAVAGPAADLGEDVLDGLASLVDQSLVRSDEVLGEPRFSMLEPIREYALERLEAAGSTDVVGERHARAYLALAEELAPALNGDGQRAALDRLELEHANLRAAIDWADARGQRRGRPRDHDRGLADVAEARLPARGADPRRRPDRVRVVPGRAAGAARQDPRGHGRDHLLARRGLRRPPRLRGGPRDLARGRRPARDRQRLLQPVVRVHDGRAPGAATGREGAGRRAAGRGALDLPIAGRRPRRGQRVLGHRDPALLRTRRRPGGARHSSRRWRCTASSATGRRRRGRCTCWARRGCGSARSTSHAGCWPQACRCSCRPATWPA